MIDSSTCRKAPNIRLVFLFVLTFILSQDAAADTVRLKDKSTLKGVIVEEHEDRYVLNTTEGEIPIFKNRVTSVDYDDSEQSYYQLGKDLQRAGRYGPALAAYQKAVDLQPDFQAAQEASYQVQRLLMQESESQASEEVRRKRILIEKTDYSLPLERRAAQEPWNQTLSRRFGFELTYAPDYLLISRVQPGGPAKIGGLEPEDQVISVWGESILHMPLVRITELLAQGGGKELSLTIRRKIRAFPGSPLKLEMNYDGLRVAPGTLILSEGFAAPRDLIVEINKKPTRYLSLADAKKLLSQEQEITIQRLVSLQGRQ